MNNIRLHPYLEINISLASNPVKARLIFIVNANLKFWRVLHSYIH